MQRGETGRYESTSAGGERVRSFVPLPLPPKPVIGLDGSLQQELETATLALGRLDAVSTLLPDETLFLYAYVRKEAVLSSQIEGRSRRCRISCCSSWRKHPAFRSTTWSRFRTTSPPSSMA